MGTTSMDSPGKICFAMFFLNHMLFRPSWVGSLFRVPWDGIVLV